MTLESYSIFYYGVFVRRIKGVYILFVKAIVNLFSYGKKDVNSTWKLHYITLYNHYITPYKKPASF